MAPTGRMLVPALVPLVLLALGAAPLGAAPERTVTLFAEPRVAGWTEPVRLFGAVGSRRGGEIVRIQARDCGSKDFVAEADVKTTEGGGWFAQFSSGVNASVRAVWRGRKSVPVAIGQRLRVTLDHDRSGHGFRVGVAAKRSFWHKHVVVERRVGTRWHPVKRVLLTDSRATEGTYGWTEARFTVSVPRGALLRAVVPTGQARPCYVDGASRTVQA